MVPSKDLPLAPPQGPGGGVFVATPTGKWVPVSMSQLNVLVEHRTDMPAGLPAVWVVDDAPPRCAATLRLYLRDDLPTGLADHYRGMAVRDAMPGIEFDLFSVRRDELPAVPSQRSPLLLSVV